MLSILETTLDYDTACWLLDLMNTQSVPVPQAIADRVTSLAPAAEHASARVDEGTPTGRTASNLLGASLSDGRSNDSLDHAASMRDALRELDSGVPITNEAADRSRQLILAGAGSALEAIDLASRVWMRPIFGSGRVPKDVAHLLIERIPELESSWDASRVQAMCGPRELPDGVVEHLLKLALTPTLVADGCRVIVYLSLYGGVSGNPVVTAYLKERLAAAPDPWEGIWLRRAMHANGDELTDEIWRRLVEIAASEPSRATELVLTFEHAELLAFGHAVVPMLHDAGVARVLALGRPR